MSGGVEVEVDVGGVEVGYLCSKRWERERERGEEAGFLVVQDLKAHIGQNLFLLI